MAKSMSYNPAAGLTGMLKEGHKSFEGIHGAVLRNIEAARAIAAMVNTSLGPNGMNKLVINHLEKVIVTSDCASILKELEVQHPAAKILVMAAEAQEDEFGDNTNFVVSFAGELLKNAAELIRNGLHTSEIISGYQRAYAKVLEILPTLATKRVEDVRDPIQLKEAIRSILATKQAGFEDFLSELVVNACLTTIPPSSRSPRLGLDSVRIAKLRGSSVLNSTVVKGMVLLRDSEGIVKRAEKARVAVFACGFEASSTEAKGTILLKNAEEMKNYNRSEERKLEEVVEAISVAGVKVVVVNGSISEMAMHFLDKFGLMVLKINSKFDLRRISGAVGGSALARLGAPTPEEMGSVSLIEVKEVCGRKITVLSQDLDEDTSIATIVLRAATEHVLNDLERGVEDGVHAVKSIMEDQRLLPGAGATEIELAEQLRAYAEGTLGIDQYGVRAFALTFDSIPRTLIETAGLDPTPLLHSLHLAHSPSPPPSATLTEPSVGFDVESAEVFDAAGKSAPPVWDPYLSKLNALRLAVDAALTVLRVDQIIMSKPAGGPKAPKNAALDDDL